MNPLAPKQILHGFELPHSDPLTIGQVARTLVVSGMTVHNLVHDQELDATNIAAPFKRNSWRITRASLVDFIKRRTTGPAGDFQALEAPQGLALPEGEILSVQQVSGFLCCHGQHVGNLIRAGQIRATNIARSTVGNARYCIARSSLIQFIDDRTEGAD